MAAWNGVVVVGATTWAMSYAQQVRPTPWYYVNGYRYKQIYMRVPPLRSPPVLMAAWNGVVVVGATTWAMSYAQQVRPTPPSVLSRWIQI